LALEPLAAEIDFICQYNLKLARSLDFAAAAHLDLAPNAGRKLSRSVNNIPGGLVPLNNVLHRRTYCLYLDGKPKAAGAQLRGIREIFEVGVEQAINERQKQVLLRFAAVESPFRFQVCGHDRAPEIDRHVLADAGYRDRSPSIVISEKSQLVGNESAKTAEFNAGPKGIHRVDDGAPTRRLSMTLES
jgi:hypothetical protein